MGSSVLLYNDLRPNEGVVRKLIDLIAYYDINNEDELQRLRALSMYASVPEKSAAVQAVIALIDSDPSFKIEEGDIASVLGLTANLLQENNYKLAVTILDKVDANVDTSIIFGASFCHIIE